jgi:flavin reductase (DIM6/NTAB) family NADH-FMN oxidoreductase RutF
MAKETLDSVGTFYQHLPKLAVIVTAQDKGKENAMTVDWHTSLSSDPPLYGICIAPGRFTYQLIAGSKEFAINFLSFEAVALIAQVGSSAGSLMNKFEQFKIAKA